MWAVAGLVSFATMSVSRASYCSSDFQTGETSLMRASRSDSRDVLTVVLEANADPNITDEVNLHYYSHYLYNSI